MSDELEIDDVFGTASNTSPNIIDQSKSFSLSTEQKLDIKKLWDDGETNVKVIIEKIFGKSIDGRSLEARAIKEYLATLGEFSFAWNKNKDKNVVLDQSQKDLITKHASTMRPLEITKAVFKNDKLSPLSAEFKKVKAFYNTCADRLIKNEDELEEYVPPRTKDNAIARVNKFTYDAIDVRKITNQQNECIKKLMKYLHMHRFIMEMNNLMKASERELFESSFIRYVWDKPDLTEEDIDLYLNVCFELIHYERMKTEEQMLIQARDEKIEEDNGKIPHALMESIKELRASIDASSKRQQMMIKDLTVKRSDRQKSKIQQNASILNLVEAFKDSSRRDQILALIKAKKAKVKDEVHRLKNMDHLKFELFGLGEEEAYGGN